MQNQLSRSRFLLGVGAGLSLVACGGGTPQVVSTASHQDLYQFMRKAGINAFADKNGITVLPELAALTRGGQALFHPKMIAQCATGPVSDARRAQCDPIDGGNSFPQTIDGLGVIGSVACSANMGSATISVAGYDFGNYTNVVGSFGPTIGPVYSTAPTPVAKNCLWEAVTSIGSTLSSIATVIQARGAAMGLSSNVIEYASWLLSGEITFAEFGGAILALLTGPEMAAVLAAAGAAALTVVAIAAYINCRSGS